MVNIVFRIIKDILEKNYKFKGIKRYIYYQYDLISQFILCSSSFVNDVVNEIEIILQ